MERSKIIKNFYNPKQVLQVDSDKNVSKSPLKAKLLLEYLERNNLNQHFETVGDFAPFTREDFLIAHHESYVTAMFEGVKPLCESNQLKWSEQFLGTLTYTNASLYAAMKHSIQHPGQVTLSMSSGFHHATPDRGNAFCSFSGQVIVSMKLYQEYGVSGAYLDLDAHYGNSINDSYHEINDLDKIIPFGCNINPIESGKRYITDLKNRLKHLTPKLLNNQIQYIVFAHGADSTVDDDFEGQLTTEQWLECSHIVYNWIRITEAKLGRCIPLTLTLFGGYRKDDYNSVLSLHTADLVTCLKVLCGVEINKLLYG